MKIILYVNSFLPNLGGREIVVHYLASALKELGHEVRVVGASGWWRNRRLKLGYPVRRYPTLRGLFAQQVRFIHLLFDVLFFGADVINAHATYPAGYVASKLKKIFPIPLVITPHGEDILAIPELKFGDRLDPERNVKIEYALLHADLVTAISDTIRDAALEVVSDPNKVRMIANGVDNRRFETRIEDDLYKWLNIPADSPLIVTVGNYHPRKGHEVIVRAMPSVIENHPNVRLVIVGPRTEALEPLIQELGLNKNVILTGRIDFPIVSMRNSETKPTLEAKQPDWLASIYQHSELYISAGIGEGAEGLSLAVLDAMATGLPIVATNISGNKDIVDDSVNGLLVQPGNEKELAKAIKKLLDDPKLLQTMGSQSREAAKKFFWINIARQYESAYRDLCS